MTRKRAEMGMRTSGLTHALSLIRLTHVRTDGHETAQRVGDDGDRHGDRKRKEHANNGLKLGGEDVDAGAGLNRATHPRSFLGRMRSQLLLVALDLFPILPIKITLVAGGP